jgi:hypothetical protein
MADHRMVDDPLQTRDDVLQHRGPCQVPDRGTDRSFDECPVEFAWFRPDFRHVSAVYYYDRPRETFTGR